MAAPRRAKESRLISAIRDAAGRLEDLTESELQQAAGALRERVTQAGPDASVVRSSGKACASTPLSPAALWREISTTPSILS